MNIQKDAFAVCRSILIAAVVAISPASALADWEGEVLDEKPAGQAAEAGWADSGGNLETIAPGLYLKSGVWQWIGSGRISISKVNLGTGEVIGEVVELAGKGVFAAVVSYLGAAGEPDTVRAGGGNSPYFYLVAEEGESFVISIKGYGSVLSNPDGLLNNPVRYDAQGGTLDVLFTVSSP